MHRKSRKKKQAFGLYQKQKNEDTKIERNQTEDTSDHATQSSSETDPDPTETVPISASRRK